MGILHILHWYSSFPIWISTPLWPETTCSDCDHQTCPLSLVSHPHDVISKEHCQVHVFSDWLTDPPAQSQNTHPGTPTSRTPDVLSELVMHLHLHRLHRIHSLALFPWKTGAVGDQKGNNHQARQQGFFRLYRTYDTSCSLPWRPGYIQPITTLTDGMQFYFLQILLNHGMSTADSSPATPG